MVFSRPSADSQAAEGKSYNLNEGEIDREREKEREREILLFPIVAVFPIIRVSRKMNEGGALLIWRALIYLFIE
jgi:hypothetical protein